MSFSNHENRRKIFKRYSADKIKPDLKIIQNAYNNYYQNKTPLFASITFKEYFIAQPRNQIPSFNEKQTNSIKKIFPSAHLKTQSRGSLLEKAIKNMGGCELTATKRRRIFRRNSDDFQLYKQTYECKRTMRKGYFLQELSHQSKQRKDFALGILKSISVFRDLLKAALKTTPKKPDPRIAPENQSRKTVIFDMDETLIHTSERATKNFQLKVPIRTANGSIGIGYVEVRPYAKQILKRLNEHFDIMIFTASTQTYADPIINYLDPQKVIKHRLYRESCSLVKRKVWVKDLRIIGRKLENVILIDNAPHSYLMQLDNAVPIINYYQGKEDNQLIKLEQYLMKLKNVKDVRIQNSEYFKLHEYIRFNCHEQLINTLYSEDIMRDVINEIN